MSENFPFAAADEDTGTDRKKLALVAGLGALMVAVLGYFVVLPALSGDSADSAPITQVKQAPQKGTKGKAKAAPKKKAVAAKKPAAPPKSYTDLRARANPFRDLYVEPKAPTAIPGGGTFQPPAGPPGAPPQGTASGGGGSSASVGGQRVALMTVYSKDGAQYAQTRIGDVVYTPKVGQVFASSYKLLAVSGKTATYLYGDEQFTLSVGQEVLK